MLGYPSCSCFTLIFRCSTLGIRCTSPIGVKENLPPLSGAFLTALELPVLLISPEAGCLISGLVSFKVNSLCIKGVVSCSESF